MATKLPLLFLLFLLNSCISTKPPAYNDSDLLDYESPRVKQELKNENEFIISQYSSDKTYGYTIENPVMVGGAGDRIGPTNERRFLNSLTGPQGEKINYSRIGSCCLFKTKNGFSGSGGGYLDRYRVTYKGLKDPLEIFINMYDSDTLKVPLGLELKK
ncbi:MAG: 2-dehydro-3-deoxyphosphooctonate aldolase [Balneola sp.]